MAKTVTVIADTTVLAHTGRGYTLWPGTFEVVEIDGAAERGFVAIRGPVDGELLLVDPDDPNITIEENSDDRG